VISHTEPASRVFSGGSSFGAAFSFTSSPEVGKRFIVWYVDIFVALCIFDVVEVSSPYTIPAQSKYFIHHQDFHLSYLKAGAKQQARIDRPLF
jgi:hypothetical protein